MLTAKGILRAGYGNKEAKGMSRAGYGNIFFLIWPHSLTNIEIQKYLPSDITLFNNHFTK